jgi:hypothetical protein
MTLQNILDEARRKLDDEQQPFLWKDDEIIQYANNAINRLCKDALLISDSTTAQICTIAVRVNIQTYPKDERIIHVREARITARARPLTKKTMDWLTCHWPTWRSAQPGTPILFAEDIDEGKITLIPTPKGSDTLSLSVYRFPLVQMANNKQSRESSPEFHWQFHPYIHEGILGQAYGKQDAECFDRTLMEKFQGVFERSVDRAKLAMYKMRYSSQTAGVHWGSV